MKNLIKRLGSGRGWSMSNNEDSNHNDKQPVQQQQQRTSKRYTRRQQQQQDQHRDRRSQQREESRSDSKSPGHRHQQHYQQSPRESGVRDLFHFSSSGEQPPQMPFQQPRQQAVFRTTDTSYGSQQQLSSGDTFHYDENQQHFNSYHHHHQSQQPSQHEHYPRDFEHVGFAQSTSPLSFYGPGASPANSHMRTPQQQQHHHHHHFDFDRNGTNCFNPDEDNCRVRFLSSSSSVSSSFSEEPSQVHMMAGCGQSVASSSCMSGSSSYLFESASKRTSKGDLAVFDKVVRGVMHEEDERLCAMGMMSINQDGTTPSLPRMRNEEFEAGVECEYHDVRDEEIHRHSTAPLPASSARASAATPVRGPPSDDKMDNQKRSEEKNEFSMTSISKWSSSYFR